MRPIDADVLTDILTTAIINKKGIAIFIGCEDDPEIKMEIQTYRDILNGVKEQPTIEPEREKGKWIVVDDAYNRISGKCSVCGWEAHMYEDDVVGMDYCPNCGARMEDKE